MNKVLVCINPSLNSTAIQYVFKQFAVLHGLNASFSNEIPKEVNIPCICYGFENIQNRNDIIFLPYSRFFHPDTYLKVSSLPVGDGNYFNIPCLLFKSNHGEQAIADPIAHSFFCLTLYEDLIFSGNRDQRHRKLFESSYFASNIEYLENPTVDLIFEHWITLLKDRFTNFTNEKLKWGNSEYCLTISRDIDSLHSHRRYSIKDFLKAILRKQLVKYLISYRNYLTKSDPHNNISEIIAWEKENALKSSFNFLAIDSPGDANYSLHEVFSNSPSLKTAIEQGWEIGFHPGTYAWQDHQEFRTQLNKLHKHHRNIQGGRQHGLRFSNPHTWRLWAENDMLYDSTVGFAEREGFRAGTCFPYQIFDLLENQTINLIEVPITIMDCTLDKYRNINPEHIATVFKNLRDKVKLVGGIFSILWHNTYFHIDKINTYDQILRNFTVETSKESCCKTHADIAKIWKERLNKFSV